MPKFCHSLSLLQQQHPYSSEAMEYMPPKQRWISLLTCLASQIVGKVVIHYIWDRWYPERNSTHNLLHVRNEGYLLRQTHKVSDAVTILSNKNFKIIIKLYLWVLHSFNGTVAQFQAPIELQESLYSLLSTGLSSSNKNYQYFRGTLQPWRMDSKFLQNTGFSQSDMVI